MLSKLFKIGLSFSIIGAQGILANAAESKRSNTKETEVITPMEAATRIYNNIETADRLYGFLKIGVSESDMQYLKELEKKSKGQKLATARAKGNQIWFQGLAKPLKVISFRNGDFAFDGRKFKLDWSKGFRANHEALSGITTARPEKIALIDWILPRAEAEFDFSMMFSGMLTVGGIGMLASSENTSMKMLGGIAAAFGIYGLISSGNSETSYPQRPVMMAPQMPMFAAPQSVSCLTGPGGWRQAYVMGPSGQLVSVGAYPGQPFQISPSAGYPYAYSQVAANQLYGMCSNPTMLNGSNYALAPAYPAAPAFTTFANQYNRPMATMSARQPASTTAGQPLYYRSADVAGTGAAR